MQQEFTDFILLKAMYNGDLSQAIFNKDSAAIIAEIIQSYQEEIFTGAIKLQNFDTDKVYEKHVKEIEELNNNPCLVQSYS